MAGSEWSMWAGEEQVRWVPPGKLYGTPELLGAIRTRLDGSKFAVTPTGPFLEATVDDPLVVSRIASECLVEMGYSDVEIGYKDLPEFPSIPPDAVG